MDAFVVFVNVSTRAQTSLHSSTHNQWRNPLMWRSSTPSKYFHIFSCKQKYKCDILPSRMYTTDNGDRLTLLSTGHLSYSSATTHCTHSISVSIMVYILSRITSGVFFVIYNNFQLLKQQCNVFQYTRYHILLAR